MQPSSTPPRRRLALLLGLLILAGAFAQAGPSAATMPREEKLTDCQFVPERFSDGDDFVLRWHGREYIFRLYGVDAPESSRQVPERVREQATAFGLSEANVLRLGQLARDFTAHQLRGHITITTRWENALGTRARFYAVVTVDRRDLGLELVRQGLARVHGREVPWLDAKARKRWRADLAAAETEAKRRHRGAWSREFPREPAAGAGTSKLDLNRAPAEDLARLPGIGPTLAGRILAGRPFTSLDDLRRVPGIGPRRLDALRSRVEVRGPPSQPAGN